MSINSEDLAARIHDSLSKMDVRPQHILPESAKNLRPRIRRSKNSGAVTVSLSSLGSNLSSDDCSSSTISRSSAKKSSEAQIVEPNEGFFQIYLGSLNWKIVVALVFVTAAIVFVYKKWNVIESLGVGYAVADTGLESVGATIAGAPSEQVNAELIALREGSHPVLSKSDKPAVHFEDEKAQMIDMLIKTATVREEDGGEKTDSAEIDEEDDSSTDDSEILAE